MTIFAYHSTPQLQMVYATVFKDENVCFCFVT